ncbi:MAG: DUF763 domain-containing protein, partial [Thermoproteota archaeon]|nr:DUF763 domain-containing protein [Thermoproteota archaeon]
DEYGQHEFLRRLSDPLWFQAFGCVLGFDWHSSGVTTVVTGVLKHSLKENVHGISIAGGKGKKSTETKNDIPRLAEKHYNLSSAKISRLLYASKMAAKIDNATVQDGYSLYHHVIFFDEDGNWAVVQQGLNSRDKMARRYHWISDNLKRFVSEPHTGIIGKCKIPNTLNMTSIDSEENQKICVELATGNINNLKSSIYKLAAINKTKQEKTLDSWIETYNLDGKYKLDNNTDSQVEHYEMPRRLDWNVFRRIYEIQPQNYEQLVSISGVGPAAIRALSLIGEIIFGTKASWKDPVKYNFAHGGKDGVPYPIARKTYDKSISYLSSAIESAEIEREQKIGALKKLAEYSSKMFTKDY